MSGYNIADKDIKEWILNLYTQGGVDMKIANYDIAQSAYSQFHRSEKSELKIELFEVDINPVEVAQAEDVLELSEEGLHLYEEKGIEAIHHINGMFAFALYDKEKQTVILGRDRMGQKPLYYAVTPQKIIFASEMKALRLHPDFQGNVKKESLFKYLFYDYLPGRDTMFSSCFSLEDFRSVPIDSHSRDDIPGFLIVLRRR